MLHSKTLFDLKRVALIIVIFLGVLMAVREVTVWHSLNVIRNNFRESVSKFQNEFFNRADEFHKKNMELKKRFQERENMLH